jgi:hypothetical protein
MYLRVLLFYRSPSVGFSVFDSKQNPVAARANKALQLTPSRDASAIATVHPFYSRAI